jgi:3-hydroxyacyl-CoA dehydrogenase
MEGAMPWDIDRVLYDFGIPMGPFAMSDLAGLDIGWSKEKSKSPHLREVLCEMDRRGQKTGAGYYDYDEKRNAKPIEVAEKIIQRLRPAKQGKQARADQRPGDPGALHLPHDQRGRQDPRRGHRDPGVRHRRGLDQRLRLAGLSRRPDVLRRPRRPAQGAGQDEGIRGQQFKPAKLLEELAASGRKFSDLNPGK